MSGTTGAHMFRQGLRSIALFAAVLVALVSPVQAAPSVSSFAPASGRLGTSITITGSGFTGATSVKFFGIAARFTILSDTKIRAVVPILARSGKITVGAAASASAFKVLPGVALSRVAAPPGATVTLSGSGFGANELVDVYESVTDMVLAVTDTFGTFSGISLKIPSSTPPGTLWISAVGRHSQLAAQDDLTVSTEWTNIGRNSAGSRWNPFENVLSPSTVRGLEMLWTTVGGSYLSNSPPGVMVASGLAVSPAGHYATLVAIRTDGTQAWSKPFTSSFFAAPTPAEGAGIVVAPSTDGKVHTYKLTTGAPLWTSPGPSDTGNGSPVVDGQVAYVPAAAQLNAYDLKTGNVNWSYAGPCTGSFSTPAVSAGTVIFTCTQSSGAPVIAVLGTDGTFRHWLSTAVGTTTAPSALGGSVYLLLGGNFVSYSLSAFNTKWSLTPPFPVSTDPAVGDGVAATCGSGGIWVVNIPDGSTRFSSTSYPCSAALTIANGVVYEPRNGDIVMFDLYGDVLGRVGSGGNVGPVSVVDGSVYANDSISGIDRWAVATSAAKTSQTTAPRPYLWQLHPDWSLKPQPTS